MSFTLPINCLACYLLAQKNLPTSTIKSPYKKLRSVPEASKRPVLITHPNAATKKKEVPLLTKLVS